MKYGMNKDTLILLPVNLKLTNLNELESIVQKQQIFIQLILNSLNPEYTCVV